VKKCAKQSVSAISAVTREGNAIESAHVLVAEVIVVIRAKNAAILEIVVVIADAMTADKLYFFSHPFSQLVSKPLNYS
jgi:CheY-like chemotaxis protein